MSDQPPLGKRFSHVYLRTDESLSSDSKRMRHRVACILASLDHRKLKKHIESEQGISLTVFYSGQWTEVFGKLELRDVLDSITTIGFFIRNHATGRRNEAAFAAWIDEVRRIFAEEGVSYRVDDQAGVHFAVDDEFERNRNSTIAGMGGNRYSNTVDLFQRAHAALDTTPPDGKGAIRHVFLSAEGLFRLMSGEAILGKSEVERFLQPLIANRFSDDVPARVSSMKMIGAFQDWIAACHQYRHEPANEEPAQPPFGLIILLVSQGAAFIRWLVDLDRNTTTASG